MQLSQPSQKSGLLAGITRAIARHPWRAIGIWVLVIAAIGVASNTLGGALQNNFSIPNSDAQKATDLLQKRFPARAGDSATIVFHTNGKLTDPAAKQAVAAALAAATKVSHVTGAGDPYTSENGQISESGNIGYADVQFDDQAWSLPENVIPDFKAAVDGAVKGSPVQVAYTGQAAQEAPKQGASEGLGILAAIIILLIVFGTVVAAVLPLFLALLAVGLGLTILTLAAGFTDFNTITPIIATMIGLGVGIDSIGPVLSRPISEAPYPFWKTRVRMPKLAAHERIVVSAAFAAITTLRNAIVRISTVIPTTKSKKIGMREKICVAISSNAAVEPPTYATAGVP